MLIIREKGVQYTQALHVETKYKMCIQCAKYAKCLQPEWSLKAKQTHWEINLKFQSWQVMTWQDCVDRHKKSLPQPKIEVVESQGETYR